MADTITDSEAPSDVNDKSSENVAATASEENKDNESKEAEPLKICSPTTTTPSKPILAQSHFGSSYSVSCAPRTIIVLPPRLKNDTAPNQVTVKDSPFRSKSILKPPTFTSGFKLKPSSLNPVTTFDKVNEEEKNGTATVSEKTGNSSNGEGLKFVPLMHEENNDSEKIHKTDTTVPAPTPVNEIQNNFVFGQNLEERVVADEARPSTSCSNGSATAELRFDSTIKEPAAVDPAAVATKESKSLSESAREYEESRAVKRKYDEVEVVTGEEGETNVCHVSCKLFSYDSAGLAWQERGRGNLRLNDRDVDEDDGTVVRQSRLVFRTSGSLRVLMNTKIWADMMLQKAGPKSIRLTAMDSNGDVKVFLIMASVEDTNRLYKYLLDRVESVKKHCKQKRIKEPSDSENAEMSVEK